jgi:hypothetical protein
VQLLLPLLLLEVAGQPATSSIDREIEEIRSAIPGDAACANPSEDDMRPYTLCLAETWFNDAEAEMDRQLKVTLAHLEATRGVRAADRLADEQLKWASVGTGNVKGRWLAPRHPSRPKYAGLPDNMDGAAHRSPEGTCRSGIAWSLMSAFHP